MHKLLQRQIRKHLSSALSVAPELGPFLDAVDAAYHQGDEDRLLLERSLSLTSAELLDRNERLQRDLSEIRRLEIELRQADKLRAVGQLAAGIAHELNTPIQYVGDSVSFIKEGYLALVELRASWDSFCAVVARDGQASAALSRLLEQARELDLDYLLAGLKGAFERTQTGLTRIAQIVGALKDFAQPAGQEKVRADLNACVLSALAVATHELEAVADIHLALGPIPLVPCHPGELNQVFLHLLTNAAHAVAARPLGGGAKGSVWVSTACEAEHVLIAVRDDGSGISREHALRIFEPFFTTKPVGMGTGQGLAASRAIVVDKHGGSLTFASEVDAGTTFFVRLPLA